MSDFVLKGAPYPIEKSPHGYLYSQKGVNQIKSDLLALLLTNPKERIMHPLFGTPLRELCFEPADATLALRARQMVIAAITKWEPRIAVSEITTTVDEENNVLTISIKFRDPQNIKDVEELLLELPVGEQ
jgi:phage baseplate assembly protein W